MIDQVIDNCLAPYAQRFILRPAALLATVGGLLWAPQGYAASASLSSPACQAFQSQALSGEGGSSTEQLVVLAHGNPVFDWTDGVVRADTAREMWSVSKTITATLIATAIQDGKIKLDDFVVRHLRPELFDARLDLRRFHQIRVRDLLAMTSGIQWTENPKASAEQQSDLAMLYSRGYSNVIDYILRLPFAAEPGTTWNYSTVNAILAMSLLQSVYGPQSNDMPWRNLFGPLGIHSARFEKDRSGTFIGGAYVHLSARDLAKIGQLYANDGVVNGRRLLPAGWVRTVAAAPVALPAAGLRNLNHFEGSGHYSQGSFWLNRPAPGAGGRRPYPRAPGNMLLASGLFGQILVVLPQQNLVIARTAHDAQDFDFPLDSVVSNAVACFGDSSGTSSVAEIAAASKSAGPQNFFELISDFNYVRDQGILPGMIAKELCSCHFVAGLETDECIRRSPLPSAVAKGMYDIFTDEANRVITVNSKFSRTPTQARFNRRSPREGCQLSYGFMEYAQ